MSALALSVAMATAGCGGSSTSDADRTYHEGGLRASDFVDPRVGANPWFPLKPGTQWIRDGTTLIGNRKVPAQVITTVTNVIREINGVKTVLVYDRGVGAGQVVNRSIDYFAQDKDGTIWNMAAVTEQFEAGRFVDIDEMWMDGMDGAKAGILMPADPTVDTPAWLIAQPPDEDGDAAEVDRMQARECVPFRCFDDVLVIREGKKSALSNEFKYFARGVGQIRNEPLGASRHEDIERLLNMTDLSPEGLAEANADALQIDQRAAEAWPEAFGKTEASIP